MEAVTKCATTTQGDIAAHVAEVILYMPLEAAGILMNVAYPVSYANAMTQQTTQDALQRVKILSEVIGAHAPTDIA